MAEIPKSVPVPKSSVSIPRPGFGVYLLHGDACETACTAALDFGFRHIDSAQQYRNEVNVQRAVGSHGSAKREDVFLTTKISKAHGSVDKTYEQMVACVDNLGGRGGYVDLFLIHVPDGGRAAREELWLALEKLQKDGRSKLIGVSNFRVHQLEEMKEYATSWPPQVNQIELHPWCQQRELVKFCQDSGIVVEAYSPLSTGENLHDPAVEEVAKKHSKTPAQVVLRWSLQKGWVPVAKSKTPARIQENLDVYGFALDEADVKKLDDLDQGFKGAKFPANVSKGLK